MDNRETARARDKKQETNLETQHENLKSGVARKKWEMLAASKVKISGSEKESEQEHKQQFFGENIRHFLRERCN